MIKQVQKIPYNIILLSNDILVLTYGTIRKVILPSRLWKGNILSSLLYLIVGLVDRVLSFEKTILHQPVFFTHKYARKPLIIAIGFLFFLTSVKWAVGPSPSEMVIEGYDIVAIEPAATAVVDLAKKKENASTPIAALNFFSPGYPAYGIPRFFSGGVFASFDKLYVRDCNFRI